MKKLAILFALSASPALAASGPFFSLSNTNFVVLLAFLLFIGALVYFKVPGMLGGMLDKRAAEIQDDLDKAKALRDEAQTVLASYERKQQEVQEQSDRIVAHAREEAEVAAAQAKADLAASIERRLLAAEDQIASAEASAVREVRDRAVAIAIEASAEAITKRLTDEKSDELIASAIAEVETKLH